jgi:hypothetical protein
MTVTVTNPGYQSNNTGDVVTLDISATGSDLSYSAVGLPEPLTINSSTGAITGTLTATGTQSTVTVTATSGDGGGSGTATFLWSVSSAVSLFNAIAFGAAGNGTGDDSGAINLAITAASASPGGGIAYVPPGTYQIQNQITVAAGTHLLIDGTIECDSGLETGFAMLHVAGGGVLIEGQGTLNGQSVAATQGISVATSHNNMTIRGITITNMADFPFNIVEFNNVVVEDLTISSCGAPAEFVGPSTSCWARNLYITDSGDSGFAFWNGVTYGGITNSTITGSSGVGIVIFQTEDNPSPCNEIVISNNIVQGSGGAGISVENTTTSNTFRGRHGRILISNNITTENSAGILVESVLNCTVIGNQSYSDAGYGILVYATLSIGSSPAAVYSVQGLQIVGNLIYAPTGDGAIGVSIQATDSTATSYQITVLSNSVNGTTSNELEYGIQVISNALDNLMVSGNAFYYATNAGSVPAGGTGIFLSGNNSNPTQ